MKYWVAIGLMLVVVALGSLIRAQYPWFPYLGLVAGLCFALGHRAGRRGR